MLARLEATVRDQSLVTLVGPPGMGKSRLAAAVRDRFDAWSCDLAGAQSTEDACDAVALGLGVDADGTPDGAIARRLAGTEDAILVLDNFDHLAERSPDLIGPWRDAAPSLHLLVTSRERLRLGGECVFRVPPLSAGVGVAVLVERLRRSRPDFVPTAAERQQLADIAVALDGIPLALELAAGPIEALGVSGFRDRLEERLSLLDRNRRDADPRQATLRGAIDDSWAALSEGAAEVLRRCSVFRGGFDLEAADAVVGRRAWSALEDLRDRSLVWMPVPGRFALYESIRLFAAEKLEADDDRDAVAARHGAHYVTRAMPRVAAYETTGTLAPSLVEEHENLRAALDDALARRDPRAARDALLALGPSFETRGPTRQYLAALDRVLALDIETPARLYVARGAARRTLGRPAEAQRDLAQALECDDPNVRMMAHKELGLIHHDRRDLDEARAHYGHALELAEKTDQRRVTAMLTGNLGALDHDRGAFESAQQAYREAIDQLRIVGDPRLEGIFLVNAAVLAHEEGRRDVARRGYRRGLELLEGGVDRRFEAIARGNLAVLDHEEGALDAAAAGHETALAALMQFGDAHSESLARARLAAIRALQGQLDEAQRGFDAAERQVAGRSPVATALVHLYRAFFDLAAGDEPGAVARLERAQRRHDEQPALSEVSDDARFALRLLAHSLSSPGVAGLEVGTDSDWFRVPGGPPVSLAQHASGRLLLSALVDLRLRNPEAVMTPEDLFTAGWPGVTIDPRSAKNRLHVALAKLRKLGLKPYLNRASGGYRLDPAVPVRQVPDGGSSSSSSP